MPPKTTSKGATRKPVPKPAASKTHGPQKPVVSRAKPAAKKAEPEKKSTRPDTAPTPKTEREASPEAAPKRAMVKREPSVSLIDKPKDAKDAQAKTKTTVLPPISKIL